MLYAQKQENKWYVDNGCYIHMTRNQSKLIKIKEEDRGKVILRNNASRRIAGKGTIDINNGRTMDQNVLYLEGLKYNILSVSQRCYQRYVSHLIPRGMKS